MVKIFRGKRVTTPPVEPNEPLVNIATLQAAGWPVPPSSEWYLDHPTPAAIKAALIAPKINDPGGTGIEVRRLWIPQTLESGNYTPAAMSSIIGTTNNMVREVIASHFHREINLDASTADTKMAAAKATFNTDIDAWIASSTPFNKILVSSNYNYHLTLVYALDWINWDDAAEFEAAFAKVKQTFELDRTTREGNGSTFSYYPGGPKDGIGYWHASGQIQAAVVESLLAACVSGINPGGASDVWADDKLSHLDEDPRTIETAVFSPFKAANCYSFLDLGNGGGREWGAYDLGPDSLGGYELQFHQSAFALLPSIETATGGAFNLLGKCLYIQNRWKGLVAHDGQNKLAAYVSGAFECLAGILGDTTAAKRYMWLVGRGTFGQYWNELRAISPPAPTAEAPSGLLATRVGSKWCYRADTGQPDTTTRITIHNRSLDSHREVGSERTMDFFTGAVGLVGGHANRSFANNALANGVWFGNKTAAGDPDHHDTGWWVKSCTQNQYQQATRAVDSDDIATDTRFLVPQISPPVLNGGSYSWSQDWITWAGIHNGSTAVDDARLTGAETDYDWNPTTEVLTITDTITIDLSDGLYLGWHFSPTHTPTTLNDTQFEFTDGTDTIRVTIEPLGAFGLTQTIRDNKAETWEHGVGEWTEMEWHNSSNGGSLDRIAANVGYVPDTITGDDVYQVRVTIEANP